MHRSPNCRLFVSSLAAAGLLFMAGCSGGDSTSLQEPEVTPGFSHTSDGGSGNEAHFKLCKEGTDALFDVEIVVDGGGTTNLTDVSVTDGNCQIVDTVDLIVGAPSPDHTVTATEQAALGTALDRIVVERWRLGSKISETTVTGQDFVTEVIDDDEGVIVTFFNVVVGGEGCTPGYWKQSQHFDSWQDFAPGDDFETVFGLAPSVALKKPESGTTSGLTLLDGLGLRGGGVNALIRHAVAGLLNADNDNVSYDMSEALVISTFLDAITNGTIESTKDTFAGLNEQGCPLN